jgi:hypothetical protein
MKHLNIFTGLLMAFMLLVGCSENEGGTEDLNYVGFETTGASVFLKAGATNSVEIPVYATTSNNSNVSVVLDESSTLDSSYFTYSTQLVSSEGEGNSYKVVIDFANYDINQIDGKSVILRLENGDGYSSEPLVVQTALDCPTLGIALDAYPGETYWFIFDAAGDVVAAGGIDLGLTALNGEYEDQDFAMVSLCELTAGDYTMAVRDSYGDGGASYTMTVNAGLDLLFFVAGDSYTDGVNVPFTIE